MTREHHVKCYRPQLNYAGMVREARDMFLEEEMSFEHKLDMIEEYSVLGDMTFELAFANILEGLRSDGSITDWLPTPKCGDLDGEYKVDFLILFPDDVIIPAQITSTKQHARERKKKIRRTFEGNYGTYPVAVFSMISSKGNRKGVEIMRQQILDSRTSTSNIAF